MRKTSTTVKAARRSNKKANSKYCRVEEVMQLLECSQSNAYKIMRKLNKELEEKGCITTAGRVSRKYLEERLYC